MTIDRTSDRISLTATVGYRDDEDDLLDPDAEGDAPDGASFEGPGGPHSVGRLSGRSDGIDRDRSGYDFLDPRPKGLLRTFFRKVRSGRRALFGKVVGLAKKALYARERGVDIERLSQLQDANTARLEPGRVEHRSSRVSVDGTSI